MRLRIVRLDKFIFSTDAPPLWKLKTRGVQMIRDLKLSPENERKVLSDNAKRLLKL